MLIQNKSTYLEELGHHIDDIVDCFEGRIIRIAQKGHCHVSDVLIRVLKGIQDRNTVVVGSALLGLLRKEDSDRKLLRTGLDTLEVHQRSI